MLSFTPFLKRIFCPILLGISLLLIAQPSLALTVKDIPNPQKLNRNWVADTADLLTADTEAKLNSIIWGLERKSSAEIAVVTVAETAPSPTPKDFATELFNYWGIGKVGKNNGVLFLISQGDRRVEIETGYGVTKILPDATIAKIIQQKILPEFERGNFDEGTIIGTQALITPLLEARQLNYEWDATAIRIVVAIVLILTSLCLFLILSPLLFPKSKSNQKADGYTGSYGVSHGLDFTDNSGSGNYGGFGGGSSGGDGGGGSFGGGDGGGGGDAGGGW